jgi:hypothetical protein
MNTINACSTGEWPAWLTRRELADYLRQVHGIRLGVSALAAQAVRGDGPPFTKDGRLTSYHRPDVDAWAQRRRSPKVKSTREWKRLRAEAFDMEAA